MNRYFTLIEHTIGLVLILVGLGFISLGDSESFRRIQLSTESLHGAIVMDCINEQQVQHRTEKDLREIRKYSFEMHDILVNLRILILVAGLYVLVNGKLKRIFEGRKK